MRPSLVRHCVPAFALLTMLLAGLAVPARADDRVVLSEIIPALDGTDLGAIDVGAAPPPGASRTVRASEVRAALGRAGHSSRGLAIPRATVVRREARDMHADEIAALARPVLDAAIAPCRAARIDAPASVRIASAAIEARADVTAPRASGRMSAPVTLVAGGRETRLVLSVAVECPAPIVAPGADVHIVAVSGSVRAIAPGTAMQPGRVGDVVRVRNRVTRSQLSARIVDARTVEVIP